MSPFTIDPLAPQLMLPATPRGVDESHRLARKSPLEIAREFEAILVTQVIGAMRKTVSSMGSLLGGANKILDGAFDQQLAESLVKGTHLGLAEQLAAQIERHQHATTSPAGGHGTGGSAVADEAARADAASALRASDAARAEDVVVARLVGGADGRVTSGFGVRRDPISGVRAFHRGIDVAAPRGSAIHAVADGEVIFSGRGRGGEGNVVEVRDGDLVSTYAHVQRALVRPGQKVAAGDVLATVGSTGRSTGPHVHFAVIRDGQVVDPTTVLGATGTAAIAAGERPHGDGEG